MMPRPVVSAASCRSTVEVPSVDERGERRTTTIACEHPLTLFLDKQELVTLMTLGCHPEALAIGYLRNQRLVESVDDIAAVQVDWEVASCAITTRSTRADLQDRLEHRTVTTGCGQGSVFGNLMDEIDTIALPTDRRLDESTYHVLMDNLRRHDSIYKTAGAVHGCALAAGAEVLMFVEDVGRHNAVDTIAGRMWLDGIEGDDKILYTTGRLTSEMVIKCAQMQIPFLISRSGLTQMGYDIARRLGMTMIGRATGRHYLLFTGEERFVRCAALGVAP